MTFEVKYLNLYPIFQVKDFSTMLECFAFHLLFLNRSEHSLEHFVRRIYRALVSSLKHNVVDGTCLR